MTAITITSRRAAVCLLLALAVVAYANSFAGAFLFDDRAVILDDLRLQSFAVFRASAAQAIRPFTKLTFLVDRWCYGDRPAGYHVLNLILHLGSGLLLFYILLHPSLRVARPCLEPPGEMSPPTGGPSPPGNGDDHRLVAFWTTLLFLVHPMATEAVTYLSGRPTGLMTCGYLAAFLLFLEARGAEGGSTRQSVAVVSAAACVALSLLAKEVAVVFPALLALYEAVLRRPKGAGVRGVLVRVHLPLSAVVILFLSLAAFHARYSFLFRYSLGLRGWYENLLTQAHAVAYAMTLFVRPWQLNFDHDLPVYTSILQGPTGFSIVALAGFAGAAVVLARRAPLFAFGVLWFFLHLLPTNSILARYDLLSERNLYLPSIGLYLAAVVGAIGLTRWFGARLRAGGHRRGAGLPPWRSASAGQAPPSSGGFGAARMTGVRCARLVAWSILAAIVVGLLGATVKRNAIYADPVTFWSDAVRKSPSKARPHTNLGHAWFLAGDVDRAIRQFRIALTLDPLDPVAQRNLLEAWTRRARPPERR